jgi:outer membrane protein assembly factor BamB
MRFFSFIIVLFCFFQLRGQNYTELIVSCSSGQLFTEFTTDADGHTFVAGSFADTLLLVPDNNQKVHKAGARLNGFVSKLDQNGKVLWTQSFPSKTLSNIYDVDIDQEGNVYVVGGFFHDDFDVHPGEEEIILNPQGGSGYFIVKLDSNGQFLWSKLLHVAVKQLALDEDANIFLGGFYYDRGDLDPSEKEFLVESPKQADGIVIKLNKEGDFQWGKRVDTKEFDEVHQLEINSKGEIVVGGLIQMNPTDSPGLKKFFVAKLNNADGKSIWYYQISSPKLVELKDLALSPTDDIVFTGEFEKSLTFKGKTMTARGYADAFLYKIKDDGSLAWAKQLGDEFQDEGAHLIVDKEGKVHWSGVLGHRAHLDDRELYYDASFYYIFKTDGGLFRNYVLGSSASDYGFRFLKSTDGEVYKIHQHYLQIHEVSRWWLF